MKLKTLLKAVPLDIYRGGKEVVITGLCSHSKLVSPGNLFIAKKGAVSDGAKYIDEAIESGAAAILSETGNPFLKNVVQLIHPDIASVEGKLASCYYGYPSSELFTIGVTGTNGKTTTSYLVKHLLDGLDRPCGLIGTIENIIRTQRYPSDRTTPDVLTNHKLLREMLTKGCSSVVMEVTSHGLVQGRTAGIDFDVAIFTNLTQDHLDYHKTMEEYASAKKLLFSSLKADKVAVVNADDPNHALMIEGCRANVLTYGIHSAADLVASSIVFTTSSTEFDVCFKGQKERISMPLIGRYNVLNCLGALGALLSQGIPLTSLSALIKTFSSVPGRLEQVGSLPIFVDYAHTPDALENVLKTLFELKHKRIITVFGCGGDRDRGKRPLMAKAAEKYSDLVIVTSDNPRSENPSSIAAEITKGFEKADYMVELDRRLAIEKAISLSTSEDLILIAGKGHETYQTFSHQTVPFDDRKVAAQYVANK